MRNTGVNNEEEYEVQKIDQVKKGRKGQSYALNELMNTNRVANMVKKCHP